MCRGVAQPRPRLVSTPDPEPRLGALATAVVVAVGMYVGARRDLVAVRRDRAEREQALQVTTARADERTCIAREMHDVPAHRLSSVTPHVGAPAFPTDLTPARTRQTAGIIQSDSQGALADLRGILGLLRDLQHGIDATGHRPQPTLGDLNASLGDERVAGARITLRSDLADLGARGGCASATACCGTTRHHDGAVRRDRR